MKINKLKIKNLFTVLFVFIYALTLYSQEFRVNLLKQLEKAQSDVDKIELLLHAGDRYNESYPETAQTYYNQAIVLAEKNELKNYAAKGIMGIGKCLMNKELYKQALNSFLQAIKYYKEINDELGVAKCYNFIGNSFELLNSLDKSMEYYFKALDNYKNLNHKLGMASVYTGLGDLNFNQANYKKAHAYYFKSIEIYKELNYKKGLSWAYTNIGNAVSELGMYDEGIKNYYKSVTLLKELNSSSSLAVVYNNIGDGFSDKGDYDKAFYYFKKTISICEQENYKLLLPLVYSNLAETSLRLNNNEDAVFYSTKSLSYSKNESLKYVEYENFNHLANAYEKLGDFKKALQNEKIYKQYSDSIFNAKKFEQVAELEVLYDYESQEKLINTLVKNEEIRSLQLTNRKILSVVLISLSVFFIAFTFYLFKIINGNKKAFKLVALEKERAEESDQLKSAFLANMSHEIRTPMNAIMGFSELLKDSELEKEKRSHFVDIINKSGDRLMAIINDIMDISKIESDQLQLELNEVNINQSLTEIIEIHKESNQLLLKKNLDLRLNLPSNAEDIYLMTDENRFTQIINNLISNALKFTNSGYVEVGYNLSNNNGKTNIEFYVKDTGCGIEKDKFKLVFDRFSQAGEKDFKTGNGLGLSICKGLINLLGGEIWLESEYGKGTTFYFNLKY